MYSEYKLLLTIKIEIMGINKNDATSFEEMAEEMDAKTAPETTEPVTTDEGTVEATKVADNTETETPA